MLKYLHFLLFPLLFASNLLGQSPTSWRVYELFSDDAMPITTEAIQKVLPGFSVFKIQSNDRASSLHAVIDAQEKVNALIFESPDYKNRMTRLVIPTPNSGADIRRVYLQDRAFKLSETQKSELLDLIANFSILTYQELDKPSTAVMVAEAFAVEKDAVAMQTMQVKGVESSPKAVKVLPEMTHPSCKIELANRHIVHQEDMALSNVGKGTVTLKICVKQSGEVYKAKFTQKGSTTLDEKLIEIAKNNATSLKFNPGTTDSECGAITYFFNH